MRRLAASSSAPIAAADRGFRGGRHSTSYERTARTLPYRAAPGHARLDHPPDPALGTAARLRHRADDPGVVTRRTPGGHRLALPCPAPARASGMDRRRVEQIREQATGAGLHLDREGAQAAGTGAIAMGAAESRDRGDSPSPGRERALSPSDDGATGGEDHAAGAKDRLPFVLITPWVRRLALCRREARANVRA